MLCRASSSSSSLSSSSSSLQRYVQLSRRIRIRTIGTPPLPLSSSCNVPRRPFLGFGSSLRGDLNRPVVARIGNYQENLVRNQDYFWCSCGRAKSQNQPWCDGNCDGTPFKALTFRVDQDKTYYLCGCKHTSKPPFCDSSHGYLQDKLDENKQYPGDINQFRATKAVIKEKEKEKDAAERERERERKRKSQDADENHTDR